MSWLRGVIYRGVKLYGVIYRGVELYGVIYRGVELYGVLYRRVKLYGVNYTVEFFAHVTISAKSKLQFKRKYFIIWIRGKYEKELWKRSKKYRDYIPLMTF